MASFWNQNRLQGPRIASRPQKTPSGLNPLTIRTPKIHSKNNGFGRIHDLRLLSWTPALPREASQCAGVPTPPRVKTWSYTLTNSFSLLRAEAKQSGLRVSRRGGPTAVHANRQFARFFHLFYMFFLDTICNDFCHFLPPKWVAKLMKNDTFSLLLGVSFFDIDFGVTFRCFGFHANGPTLKIHCKNNGFGRFFDFPCFEERDQKLSTNCFKNHLKSYKNHTKTTSRNTPIFVLAFFSHFYRCGLNFGCLFDSIRKPFWVKKQIFPPMTLP